MLLQFYIYEEIDPEQFHQVVTLSFKESQDWCKHVENNRTFFEVAIFELKKTFESLYPTCKVILSTIFDSASLYINMGHTTNEAGECVECERTGLHVYSANFGGGK